MIEILTDNHYDKIVDLFEAIFDMIIPSGAKDFLDEKLDVLKNQYGMIEYVSEP